MTQQEQGRDSVQPDNSRAHASSKAEARQRVVLICGPWSSGTSAMAGFLAKAGVFAPGPYLKVNDPRTPDTFEMIAFRSVLMQLASEETLKRTASPEQILIALRAFRDGPLAAAKQAAGCPEIQPVILKHGLSILLLPELCQVFDVRIVCVLRPSADIEATRQRRRWAPVYGVLGARVLYSMLFDFIVNSDTPFCMIRYKQLLQNPALIYNGLAQFIGIPQHPDRRQAAVDHVARGSENPPRPA